MSEIDSLLELNKLYKERAEHDLVSAMFISIANTSHILDKFSMWLFAGTGATGALFITQINSILSNMSITGFNACLIMLIASSIFAFVAKYFSLCCQVGTQAITTFLEKANTIYENYTKDKDRIEEIARERGIELDTNLDPQIFHRESARQFPKFMQGWMMRHAQKPESDPQAGYHQIVQAYHTQSIFTLLQALAFIGFMCSGGWFAGSLQ